MRLQTEVAERDEAITELQNNVEQLNHIQLENTKDKTALCEELTEAFNQKNALKNQLDDELTKNACLNESRREYENVAQSQVNLIILKYQYIQNITLQVQNFLLDIAHFIF